MTVRLAACVLGLLVCVSSAYAGSDTLARPVKDCQPCRLSPGPGQPVLDLRFVFNSDHATLTALAITPEGGGKTQRLATGGIAGADFPDGFILDDADITFDGYRDLALITQQAADNTEATYWVYRPASHDFVPLQRIGDDGAGEVLSPGPDHRLTSTARDGYVGRTTYSYRVSGDRAVAVRKTVMGANGPVMQETTFDLTVKPARVVRRTTLGFVGDSPQRTHFLAALAAASRQADTLYRRGDKAGAVAALAPVMKDKQLALLTASYPPGSDASDQRIVEEVNNYGFYLAEAGRPKDAVAVLSAVVDAAPGRIVAYLNLADAQYAAGDAADAKTNYAEYARRMTASGRAARIPPRVGERAQ